MVWVWCQIDGGAAGGVHGVHGNENCVAHTPARPRLLPLIMPRPLLGCADARAPAQRRVRGDRVPPPRAREPKKDQGTRRRPVPGFLGGGVRREFFFFFLSEHASGRPVRTRFSLVRAPPTCAPSDFAEQARLLSSAQGARPRAASRPRARGLLLVAVLAASRAGDAD